MLVSLAWRYGLGFDAPWYLLELVGIGYIKPIAVVIVLAGAAAAAQLAAAAAGRYAPYPTRDRARAARAVPGGRVPPAPSLAVGAPGVTLQARGS